MTATVPRAAVLVALWLLAALAGAAPVNDHLGNAVVIPGASNVVSGSNLGATSEPGEPYHGGDAGQSSVWWKWTSPRTGTVILSTAGSSFDTVLAVYTGGSVAHLAPVASNDDSDASQGIHTSRVALRAVAGETFRIAVDGYRGAMGSIRLEVGPAGTPFPDAT